MKAFVFGALLLQTLNAQSVTDDFASDVATSDDLTATAAPLIVPGPDAPTEAELSAGANADAGASAEATPTPTLDDLTSAITAVAQGLDDLNSAITAAADSSSLPTGTADVIIDTSTLESPSSIESTPTLDAFGASETADAGVSASLDAGFTFPTAGAQESGGLDAAAASTSDDFLGTGATATGGGTGITQDFLGFSSETPTAAATSDDAAFPTDFGFNAGATAGAGFGAADASGETAGATDATGVTEPPQPIETSALANSSATGLSEPIVTPAGAGFGSPIGSGVGAQAAGGVGAQAFNGSSGGGARAFNGSSGGIIVDNNQYDGQDLPDDDDPAEDADCPWWCYIDAEDTGDNDRQVAPTKKTGSKRRGALGARQQPSSGGFAAFNWPDDGGDGDDAEGDDDVPTWASDPSAQPTDGPSVESTDQGADPTQGCPAKCYTQSTMTGSPPRPTFTFTRRPWPSHTTGTTGYPTQTTTTLVTKTQSRKPYTPFSSVLASNVDWTGNTLAGICPKTCNPFDPAKNLCDLTTSCTTTGGSNYYCACRAGFLASAWNAKDFSKQFKIDGLPYVYVAPGVACDKQCDDRTTCSEVLTRPKCK